MKQKILELFTHAQHLPFATMERRLNTRSNKLTYHLKKLIRQGILIKDQEEYALAESSIPLIPYLSEKKAMLPVLLIHIGNATESFLIHREKRPYKDKLSLPAGRIIVGESLAKATERIMQEKCGVKAKFKTLHSISLEHVRKNKEILHSFVLFFITATASQPLTLTNIINQKSKIITSDYHLLKNDLNKKIKIPTINSKT